jgi:hypothetical protein
MVLKIEGAISWSWWIILGPIIFIFCVLVAVVAFVVSLDAFESILNFFINRGKK